MVTVVDNCDGTSVLSTIATGNLLWITGESTSSITVSSAGTYTVTATVNGCTSEAGSGVASPRSTPSAPVVTVTDNCNGTSVLSTTATGTLLWNTGESTSSITVSSAGTYTVTATVNGCTSEAGSGVASPRSAPSIPVVTVINNCDGTSVLSTNAAGTLLWNTGESTSSITVTSAGTYTVTSTVNGCTSLTGSGTASPKLTPAIPGILVANNCNGTSTLTATGIGSFLWSTTETTSEIIVTTAGAYSVTATVDGCISMPAIATAAPKSTPATPAVTVVNNCNGTSTLSTNASGILLWNTGESTSLITVTSPGTYTVTSTANGCTSAAGSGIAAPKSAPATPVVTVTNNCGSSVLSTTATGTLLWNTGESTSSITVTTAGTYSVTATANGCTSASGNGIAAPKAIPATPTVGTIVQPTCSVATGSVTLTGLPSGSWTLTRNPGNVITTGATATTTISGLTAGSYTFSIKNTDGCSSVAAASVVINTRPATPAKPTVGTITQPTCTVATGSVILSNLPAGAWTITSTPSTFTTTGNTTSVTITGIPANNTYVFKVTNSAGCISPASGSVLINAQPASPATPTVSVTQPTCSVATGKITVTSSKSGLTFSINGSTYTNTTGVFSGLVAGTYNLTAKNAVGCISAQVPVTITAATACSSIGNFVFSDANSNGKQDSGEPGIAGVTVNLLNTSNAVLATTATNSSGNYAFNNLVAGTYRVQFVTPAGYTPTSSNVGTDDTKDSDPVSGITGNYTVSFGQSNTTVDAGFIPPILQVGNRVWYDSNNDGINGTSENGIRGVTVRLYIDANNDNVADGAAIRTATTDANGYYNFNSLPAGNYIIGAVLPAGYMSSSLSNTDPDNNTDNNDDGRVLVSGEIRGYAITLANGTEPGGSTNNTYDFGMLPDCNCINTSGNLLTNGSFESGTTGWTASGGSVSTGTGYTACGTKNGFNNASRKLSEVYQDVTIAAGTTVTFSGFAGIHTAGLTCSPKISLIFRSSSGAVLGRTDVAVTRDVDINFGQLALYTITATAPSGTAKVRVQTSTTCNAMKMDAFCLRVTGSGRDINNTWTTIPETTSSSEDVVAGNSNETISLDAVVYPNPVVGYCYVNITSSDKLSGVDIRILNVDGKVVFMQKSVTGNSVRVNTSSWRTGMYYVEVLQGKQRKVMKLIKANN